MFVGIAMDRLWSQFVTGFLCFNLMSLINRGSAALTVSQQQEIVYQHNIIRAKEGASNMQQLTWNPTLARMAQNWTDGCNYVYGQGVNSSTLNNLNIGQSLYTLTPPLDIWNAVFSRWQQKYAYSYANNSCAKAYAPGYTCTDFLQMVWASTNQIGCAYSNCSRLKTVEYTNAVFFTCYYASRGNIAGQLPYSKGPACSACPSTMPFCNRGLCSATLAPTSPPSPTPDPTCLWIPRDCNDYKLNGWTTNGVYAVWPVGYTRPLKVYCDMVTDGGGWTVFQRRQDGSVDFAQEWYDYSNGFGNISGEFWLGNEKVYSLLNANKNYSLRIDMGDYSGNFRYASYNNFRIASSSDRYRLASLGNFQGNVQHDAMRVHENTRFATVDNDPDNVMIYWRRGWWIDWGIACFLNGRWYPTDTGAADGIQWAQTGLSSYLIKFVEMKFRPN